MIYLDPLCNHGWMLRGRPTRSCHAFTDGPEEELHAFAERVGLKRKWFQGLAHAKVPHYDIAEGRHPSALLAGAKMVAMREAVAIWRRMGWIAARAPVQGTEGKG